MFFIVRAGDDFEQIVLTEGSDAEAPHPNDNPPCWHFNTHEYSDVRPALEANSFNENIFRPIEAKDTIVYFSHTADAFGWSAEYPREGFETKQAVWDCIRTKWVEKQLALLAEMQTHFEDHLKKAEQEGDAEKQKIYSDHLTEISNHTTKLKTT